MGVSSSDPLAGVGARNPAAGDTKCLRSRGVSGIPVALAFARREWKGGPAGPAVRRVAPPRSVRLRGMLRTRETLLALIISVHSFRGGTGKSNTTANVATLLASEGKRVGIVDTDIQSPGIHVLFGMDESQMVHSLNDYLWGKCEIKETAHDVG